MTILRPKLTDAGKTLLLRLYTAGVPLHKIRDELAPLSPDGVPSSYQLGTIASNNHARRPEGFSYDRATARKSASPMALDAAQAVMAVRPIPMARNHTEAVMDGSRRMLVRDVASHFAPIPYTAEEIRKYAANNRIPVDGDAFGAVNAWRVLAGLPPFCLGRGIGYARLPAPHIGVSYGGESR